MANEDSWIGDFKVRSLQIAEDPAIKRIRERDLRDNINPDNALTRVRAAEGTANFDTLDINFTRNGDIMTIISIASRSELAHFKNVS